MPDNDLQTDPSGLQSEGGDNSAGGASAYNPPAYGGKVLVTVDWASTNPSPEVSAFALPESLWLKVDATTPAGGMLDPAGVPLQVALATSMHPSAAGLALAWANVVFDEDTRLAEVRIPLGTAPGCYYLVWRALLTNNAPTNQGGIVESAVLTVG